MQKKVLIVEGEANLRRILGIFVESDGYTVLNAASVDDAKKVILKENPEVVIADGFGDQDGFAVLKEIKTSGPNHYVSLVMVGGTADWRSKVEEHGADDYLQKPILRDTLLSIIKKAVAKANRNKERRIANRVSLTAQVTVKGKGGSLRERILDISTKGLSFEYHPDEESKNVVEKGVHTLLRFIKAGHLLEPGKPAVVNFNLPDGSTVEVNCKIVYVDRIDETRHVKKTGVEFVNPSKEITEKISKITKDVQH